MRLFGRPKTVEEAVEEALANDQGVAAIRSGWTASGVGEEYRQRDKRTYRTILTSRLDQLAWDIFMEFVSRQLPFQSKHSLPLGVLC